MFSRNGYGEDVDIRLKTPESNPNFERKLSPHRHSSTWQVTYPPFSKSMSWICHLDTFSATIAYNQTCKNHGSDGSMASREQYLQRATKEAMFTGSLRTCLWERNHRCSWEQWWGWHCKRKPGQCQEFEPRDATINCPAAVRHYSSEFQSPSFQGLSPGIE